MNSKKTKTYVFDLDGTLIDSKKRHCILMEWLLRKEMIQISSEFEDIFMAYKESGRSGLDFLLYSLRLPREKAKQINSEWIAHIEDIELLVFDRLYEDADDILEQIKKNGERIIFLTSRANEKGLKDELVRLGLMKYVSELIVVKPDVKNGKISELEKLTEKYDDIIVIGDTENEYDAAESLGVESYILHRGFRNREFWRRRGVCSHYNLRRLFSSKSNDYGNYLVIFVEILRAQNRDRFDDLYRINSTFHETFLLNQKNDEEYRAYRRKVFTFSDCAYIFYGFKDGLEEEGKDLAKLFTTAFCNCEPVFLDLLREKIIFRGAVYYGDAYYDNHRSMFFGDAVNKAYQMGSKEAINPRILVDDFVANTLNEHIKDVNYKMSANGLNQAMFLGSGLIGMDTLTGYGMIARDLDGRHIFNFLYFPENNIVCNNEISGERLIKELIQFCDEQIAELSDYRVIDKYNYLKRFCEGKLDTLMVGHSSI